LLTVVQVVRARYAGDFKLDVEFDDGSQGVADLAALIARAPVFEPLRDVAEFARVYVEDGTVCWPSDLDVPTERIYALAHALPAPASYEQSLANETTVRGRQGLTSR
jgi:hypothetical protein